MTFCSAAVNSLGEIASPCLTPFSTWTLSIRSNSWILVEVPEKHSSVGACRHWEFRHALRYIKQHSFPQGRRLFCSPRRWEEDGIRDSFQSAEWLLECPRGRISSCRNRLAPLLSSRPSVQGSFRICRIFVKVLNTMESKSRLVIHNVFTLALLEQQHCSWFLPLIWSLSKTWVEIEMLCEKLV